MIATTTRSLAIPAGKTWLHATLRSPALPRAAILLLPPFFHEWQRSYRLFAQLAEALACTGIAVLRFDYRGCGDSGGADEEFLPSRAMADADAALSFLRTMTDARIVLLGVRAGGLIARPLAEREGLPLWLWQPVADGASHLSELRERSLLQRNSRLRFPFLGRRQPPDLGVLMGHRLHPEFALELGILHNAREPALVIGPTEAATGAAALGLEPALASWVGQVDISGSFPLPAIRRLAAGMAERMPG